MISTLDLSEAPASPPADVGLTARWRLAWRGSLRFRLFALGLMPLLVAFPFVIAVLVVVGGARADDLLAANLRSSLSGATSYLDQFKAQAGTRVSQLARSERLVHLLDRPDARADLDRQLSAAAEGAGLDFLVAATADGRVLGSSTGVPLGQRLPESWVIRQARIGVSQVAYERFDAAQLAAFSPQFAEQARIGLPGGGSESRALLIHAAAHFPLSVQTSDAILVGGVLLNRNFPLVEHMREVIYPVGSLPEEAEGLTALHLDGVAIATSRQRLQGQRSVGQSAPSGALTKVLGAGGNWLGQMEQAGARYRVGYAALRDGEGRAIGLIAAGFPDVPFHRMAGWLLGMVAALLALTMLTISLLYLQAGRELTQRLGRIARTMAQVRQGDRQARVGTPLRNDELGRLTQHFDELLDTIEAQDRRQRAAQQAIADEASLRRSLFESERDGVIILNDDGSVHEANPKALAMLGYSAEELQRLRLLDWDEQLTRADVAQLIDRVGPEGSFFETVHRRRDGSHYAAEVSVSRVQWGERAFTFLLQRDISERKAVESELLRYRAALESLVTERTRELNARSEQLDAIFALSPDGFVSFDDQRRVSFANRAFLDAAGLDADTVMGMDEAVFSALLQAACHEAAPFPGVAQLRAERLRRHEGPEGAADAERLGDAAPAGQRRVFELLHPRRRVVEVGIRLAQTDTVSQLLYFRDVTHETEVDRMKSEFLSTAAHELRTPMTSIYGFVQLLGQREFAPPRRAELLGTIARQSERMITIINQLLDLARIEARRGQDFVFAPLRLADLVRDVVAGYPPPAGRDAPTLAADGAVLSVRADRQKLEQALLNIVANAYKYSPAGGAVEIDYRCDDGEGPLRVGVRVRDHGLGMTEEQRSHVCERFYRADASGNIPGTGLGMSIVKEIVELHQGEVEIDSAPGVGTAVTLWFPAWGPIPPAEAPEALLGTAASPAPAPALQAT